MTKQWTEQQLKAITTHQKSLLVAAAAGSGKTAVLVERIIALVMDEQSSVSIDQLLVVTFTNAAAAEMRERIGQALQEALKQNPHSEHLYQQSLLVNKAQITTLHSFCLELVRSHFYLLGLSPSLKIMDEIEGRLLKQEVLEETLEAYYGDSEKGFAFAQLVDQFGGREDEGVQSLVLRLYEQSMSMAQPEVWLGQLADKLVETDWVGGYWPSVIKMLSQGQFKLEQALAIAQSAEGLERYVFQLAEEAEHFRQLQKAAALGWDALSQIIETKGNFWGRLPALKKDSYDLEAKLTAQAKRDEAKALYRQLENLLAGRTIEELARDVKLQYPWAALLAEVTMAFLQAYQLKKQEKELMDFDDMEHYCLKLLYETDAQGMTVPTALSHTLKASYAEVMVDEYQDINDLQESILQGVCRADNLFMVGDIKQSIYGFRMANPQLFLHKYETFPLTEEQENSAMRIDLNRNFRCREHIIEAVNTVFERLMTGEAGDLLYDAHAALVSGAYYPPKIGEQAPEQLEAIIIEQTALEDEEADSEEPQTKRLSAIVLEAQAAAVRIQKMFADGEEVYDTQIGAYRPLRYSDIVLLMRSPKASAQLIRQQLEQSGIPVYAGYGEGYFESWEVQIVLALLQVLDNPLQDIPLAAVLHAPFGDFSEADLLALRLQDDSSDLFHSLQAAAAQEDAPLALKARKFLEQLALWRNAARQKETSMLIWQLYRETGFYDYVGALSGGPQRQANLRALHEKARVYEQTSFSGLFSFLKFIEQMKRQEQDLEPAKVLSENADVVRLFSIHKSKGLEFPVVFLLGLGKSFNFRDIQQDVVIDREYGLGMPVILPEEHLRYTTIAQQFIKQRLKQQALTEEKRVLYVAMTRAREKLILLGTVKNFTERYEKLPAGEVDGMTARCYLDWLLPVIKEQVNAGKWRLEVLTDQDLGQPLEKLQEGLLDMEALKKLEPLAVPAECPIAQETVSQKLAWQYPDPFAARIRSKVTVTELGRISQGAIEVGKVDQARRPLCLAEKKGLSPAEKGTLLHLLMRHVDLRQKIDETALQKLASRLEAEQYVPSEQIEAEDLQKVCAFFQTDIGQRLQRAEVIYRELPFTVTLDSHLLEPEALPETKPVLLQGMIDCIWWEQEGWVLVDYKNDNLRSEDIAAFVSRHQEQVQLYAQAVEKIWKKPVKACYLYMFALNQYVSVEF